jgi:hypothetical protein
MLILFDQLLEFDYDFCKIIIHYLRLTLHIMMRFFVLRSCICYA